MKDLVIKAKDITSTETALLIQFSVVPNTIVVYRRATAQFSELDKS